MIKNFLFLLLLLNPLFAGLKTNNSQLVSCLVKQFGQELTLTHSSRLSEEKITKRLLDDNEFMIHLKKVLSEYNDKLDLGKADRLNILLVDPEFSQDIHYLIALGFKDISLPVLISKAFLENNLEQEIKER